MFEVREDDVGLVRDGTVAFVPRSCTVRRPGRNEVGNEVEKERNRDLVLP